MEDLTSQAEEATNKGEQGQVYKITKLVSSKYRRDTDMPIVDSRKSYSPRKQSRSQDGQSI